MADVPDQNRLIPHFFLFNQNVPKYIAHEMCNNFSAFRPYIVKDTATLCFKGRMILVVLYVRS
jgi:hypothetical protein